MQQLIDHINRFVNLTPSESELIPEYIHILNLKKKEHLQEEGKICSAQYFVVKGCLRMYFHSYKGEDQIVQFAIENWWISDYMSFDRQSVSPFSIQAIEPSVVLVLDRNKQDELLTKVPKLERYFRLVLQRAFSASQMRFKYISDFSGEERYHHFNNSFPEFIQRVPQYMLASYLGFTPEFLSKIRARRN